VQVTACDEDVPKWSFHASKAKIKTGDRVRVYSPKLKLKNIPVFYLPYASVSIKPRDRASGFLTPTFGGSGAKGAVCRRLLSNTRPLRRLHFPQRHLHFSVDSDLAATCARAPIRARISTSASTQSRIASLDHPLTTAHPGSGRLESLRRWRALLQKRFHRRADVNITSNLAFRQVFSDNIQQAISPEETSQVFINKDHNEYSFNFLARTQVTSLTNARIRIRQLPSISIDKRPAIVSFFQGNLPVYFSFSGSADGVSRKETVEDAVQFVNDVGGNPIITPSIVQRLDLHPRFELPLNFAGWSITASGAGRVTFYSNSLDPNTRDVLSRNVTRSYGEFELDVRPPAFARDFRAAAISFFVT
jgi:LPS-assembly protein